MDNKFRDPILELRQKQIMLQNFLLNQKNEQELEKENNMFNGSFARNLILVS